LLVAPAQHQTNDAGHIWLVGSYFHFTQGFGAPVVHDITAKPGYVDPMYVVSATKLGGGAKAEL
jgi:hypothetical protein